MGVESEVRREQVRVAREAAARRLLVEYLLEAAGGPRRRPRRVCEHARLGHHLRVRGARRRVRADRARLVAGRARVRLRHGVVALHRAERRVRVLVAVHVLEDHVAAQALALAHLLDLPVVRGDDRSALVREDRDLVAPRVVLDHVGGVLAGLDVA